MTRQYNTMNKGLFKNIFIVLLISITIFSVFKYGSSLKEKYALLNTLNQIKEQVTTLENDKQGLLEKLGEEKELNAQLNGEVSEIKDYLRASKERLAKLFADYGQAQKTIEDLNSKFSILKSENTALRDEKEKLDTQLTQVSQEKNSLKAKLSSITELKKRIRELKRQMRRVTAHKPKARKIIEGNRGFLIKNGKPTYPAKIKIEVIPVPQDK